MLSQIFKSVTIESICKEIPALDALRATQSDDIPTKIVKNNSIFSFFFKQTLMKEVLSQSN